LTQDINHFESNEINTDHLNNNNTKKDSGAANANGSGEITMTNSDNVKKVLLYLMNDMILVTQIVENVNNDDDDDEDLEETSNSSNNNLSPCGAETQVMPIQRVLHLFVYYSCPY
jgi:hypothetical protein